MIFVVFHYALSVSYANIRPGSTMYVFISFLSLELTQALAGEEEGGKGSKESEFDEFDSKTPNPPEFGLDYVQTDAGTQEVHMDFRNSSEDYDYDSRPAPNDGPLFRDNEFQLHDAVPAKAGQLEWKRPVVSRAEKEL